MKKVTLLIALLFILSACQSRLTPTPVEVLPTPSRTPSPTGSPTPNATERYQGTLQANQTANAGYFATQTALSTLSSIPKVANQTPQPTPSAAFLPISTPTPSETLDPSKIPTVTPALPATCPQENPDLVPYFPTPTPYAILPSDREIPLVEYLNSGGTWQSLREYFQIPTESNPNFLERDLTNDGIPEFLYSDFHLKIYSCKNGHYFIAADVSPYTWIPPTYLAVLDMNSNGLPEILIARPEDGSVGLFQDYQILEWDGEKFQNLVSPDDYENPFIYGHFVMPDWIVIEGVGHDGKFFDWKTQDIDHNGTLELILAGGGFYWDLDLPNRNRVFTAIYMWDGRYFALYDAEYDPPIFRYQAILDGDYASLKGQYDKARASYELAISSDTLEWWSTERSKYYEVSYYGVGEQTPTPIPPTPDPDERKVLTAYAYFRMMLLDVMEGTLSKAQEQYDTLKSEFVEGQVGYVFTEMATAFWSTYQTSQNIELACQATITLAEFEKDSTYGFLGIYYQEYYFHPEWLCPFK